MANYPQALAQDAVCHSNTGHMTGLWFLPTRPLRLNTNDWMFPLKTQQIQCVSFYRCPQHRSCHGIHRRVQVYCAIELPWPVRQ